MKLHPSHIDETSLSHLGGEVVILLKERDFNSLAVRYGYAFAVGRPLALAIEEELQACINNSRALIDQQKSIRPSTVVKYFEPNKSNLFALVECVFIHSEWCPILAELIVISKGEDKFIFLEEVSLAVA